MIIKANLKQIAQELGLSYIQLRWTVEQNTSNDWLIVERPTDEEISYKKSKQRTKFPVIRNKYFIDVEKYQTFKIEYLKKRNEIDRLEKEYKQQNIEMDKNENFRLVRELGIENV